MTAPEKKSAGRHAVPRPGRPPAANFGGSAPAGRPVPVLPTRTAASAGATAPTRRHPRDRYIDTLRALALVRVVAFHLFGWLWLRYAFPSMGVMFALAGSLMVASLDRTQRGALTVVKRRMRRLLPPYWAYGLAVVPVLLLIGWSTENSGEALTPLRALAWVIPYASPPSSDEGLNITIHLWYIGAYMWMMLTSVFTLTLFRRHPLVAIAAPFTVPLILLVAGQMGYSFVDDPVTAMIAIVMVHLPCWMLGYAHHDGLIRKVPLVPALLLGVGLLVAGLVVGFVYSEPGAGIPLFGGNLDVMGVDFAAALYSLGFVTVLLCLYPDFSWMKKVRPLDAVVASMNSRAMTIYLWGNVAIAVAHRLLGLFPPTASLVNTGGGLGNLLLFLAVWTVLFCIVLGIGWVEDLAARRRPRLLPRTHLD